MTQLPLHEQVALRCDLPLHGIRSGDVVTLLDYVPHPDGKREGCIVEVFNAVGDSIAVVTVEAGDIESLKPNEVLTVRRLAQAS